MVKILSFVRFTPTFKSNYYFIAVEITHGIFHLGNRNTLAPSARKQRLSRTSPSECSLILPDLLKTKLHPLRCLLPRVSYSSKSRRAGWTREAMKLPTDYSLSFTQVCTEDMHCASAALDAGDGAVNKTCKRLSVFKELLF